MAKYQIGVHSMGSLLQSGFPEKEADALVQFFQDKFDIAVKVPWLSETELPNEEKVVLTKDIVSLGYKIAPTNYLEDGDSIEFIGGSLLKLNSNQGSHWFVVISNTEEPRSGAQKSVHRIERVLLITKTGEIKDKWFFVGRYVLILYSQKSPNMKKLQEEVTQNKAFNSSTKPLTLFKSDSGEDQYGFVMRDYGRDLSEISTNAVIPLMMIERAKELLRKRKTHMDLKLENICYHPEYKEKAKNHKTVGIVNFIDLEGIKSVDEWIEGEIPCITEAYVNPFFMNKENAVLLRYGQYRVVQYLYALVFSCYQFMAHKSADDEEFLNSIQQNELIIKINKFIDWLDENKDKLTQAELIEKSFQYAMHSIDLLAEKLTDPCAAEGLAEDVLSLNSQNSDDSSSSLSFSSEGAKTESPISPISPLSLQDTVIEKRKGSTESESKKRKEYKFWQLPDKESIPELSSSRRNAQPSFKRACHGIRP